MTKKNDSINFDKLSIDPDAPVISPEAAKGDLFTNLSGENPQSDDTSADTVIIDFNEGEKNGQEKCPMCGATDIALNVNSGKLRCNFCRHEFSPVGVANTVDDVENLTGKVIGAGAQRIQADTEDILTLKCTGCGAEVVIDTAESAQARCHWCRNTLSVNEKIPNGAIPDVVLPFSVKQDEARDAIEAFVKKRRFFANGKFKKEFSTENVMGVYFPYMLVDINAHGDFSGQGEHLVSSYTVGSDDNRERRYDADLYNVRRRFDIAIDDLSIESSSERLDNASKSQTNNIINSIMPFDTENCVKWNANYIKGFTSEKRDVDIEHLDNIVMTQAKDVAKFSINDTVKNYDRGVRWDDQSLIVKGQQWIAAYLPVWLYSYHEKKSGDKSILHYVAVNARTKETMGSIPVNMAKLFMISAIVEIIGALIMVLTFDYTESYLKYGLLLPGIAFFAIIYGYYRNRGARHTYETETNCKISNLETYDQLVRRLRGLRNSTMDGANNNVVSGASTSSILDSIGSITDFDKSSLTGEFIKNVSDKFKK